MRIMLIFIRNIEAICAGVCFTLMLLLINVEVFRRYVFMSPGAYSEEVAKFLSIYSIFFSMAYAVKENAHIVTDILPDNLPVRVSTAIDIFANVAFLAFSMLMIYFGIEYTQSMYLFERPTEAMSAPLWIFITILPIGFALTSVRLLLKLRLLVRAMKTGEKIQTVEIF